MLPAVRKIIKIDGRIKNEKGTIQGKVSIAFFI